MSKVLDNNRRKYPRAAFACEMTLWRDDGSAQVFLTQTVNISAGGVCVFLDHRLNLGSKVDIKINFVQPSIPFKCKGKIVRTEAVARHVIETAVEFEGLDEVKQTFLYGKVSELMDKEAHGQ